MGIGLLISLLSSLLQLYEVSSIELTANYRFWDSSSDRFAHDYSGKNNHAGLEGNLFITDRGLSATNNSTIIALKYVNSILLGSQEITVSFWLLNHKAPGTLTINPNFPVHPQEFICSFSYKFSNTGTNATIVMTNMLGTQTVNINPNTSIEKWNLHTIRIYAASYNPEILKIDSYLNLLQILNHQINTSTLLRIRSDFSVMFQDDDDSDIYDMIMYEMWVHSGFSTISDLDSLISTGGSCSCINGCVTFPSVICLPDYQKYMSRQNIDCRIDCAGNLLCNRFANCLSISKPECEFNAYSLQTDECIFFCPEDSCILKDVPGTPLAISFSCKEGYKQIANSPYACISSICKNYKREGYSYICDETEEGYELDSSGNCCVCQEHAYKVSDNPLVCIYIPYCLDYEYIVDRYKCVSCSYGYTLDEEGNCKIPNCLADGFIEDRHICVSCSPGYMIDEEGDCKIPNCLAYGFIEDRHRCVSCSPGYMIDEEGTCNICDAGYSIISDHPLICASKPERCEILSKHGNEWVCDSCNEGFIKGNFGKCDTCDEGYVQIQGDNITCVLEITKCIEYNLEFHESGCNTCEIGYSVDSNFKCENCEEGYFRVAEDPVRCGKEVIYCEEYNEVDGDWICETCVEGYKMIELEEIYCVKEVEFCMEYDMREDITVCSICNYGRKLEGMKCICGKGFYSTFSYACEVCPESCADCMLESSEVKCIECKSNYILEDSACLSYEESISKETSISSAIATSVQAIQIVLIFSSAASILSMNFYKGLSMIGTVQILSYSLLYNIHIPTRSKVILQGLSLFNIIPNTFEYFIPNEDTLKISRYERLDFNNELFLINSGKTLTVFLALLLFTFYLKFMKYLARNLPKASIFKQTAERLLQEFQWNFMINYILQLSLELTVSSLVNIYFVSLSDIHSIIGFCISTLVLVRCN
jgi:hypothetical protein